MKIAGTNILMPKVASNAFVPRPPGSCVRTKMLPFQPVRYPILGSPGSDGTASTPTGMQEKCHVSHMFQEGLMGTAREHCGNMIDQWSVAELLNLANP